MAAGVDSAPAPGCACGTPAPPGARFCPGCGSPLEAAPEVRKLVTVVFCDLEGSTALAERLGPEAIRHVLRRFLGAMRGAAERHGGTVEPLVGDAVMVVFGVPTAREDDALRALRAVLDMQAALVALNEDLMSDWEVELRARFGVNSGEVVTAAPRGAGAVALGDVLGDAVNVAARLQGVAAPGEVLLGDLTRRLAGSAVRARERAVTLRGRAAEQATAWSLEGLADTAAPPAVHGAPFLGREAELLALGHALDAVVAERRCRLVTVLGEPGVGKSRLLDEFAHGLPAGGRRVRGRCLPYGEGITFWAVAEILRDVLGTRYDAPAEAVRAAIDDVVGDQPDAAFLSAALAGLFGLGDGVAGEDLALAVRRLLELLARQAPLVVELDDLQWAEPPLLDLVEALPRRLSGAPVLVVALGRPELGELRPALAGPAAVSLEPLPAHTAERLVAALLPEAGAAERRRVADAAQGNPFFAEQLAAAGPNSTDGVPPTLGVLLQARLERLPAAQRLLLERAAVVGEEFELADLAALGVADAEATAGRLVACGLLHQPRAAGRLRFRHLLLRDAAYDRLPRAACGDLHERFAAFLDSRPSDRRADVDAIAAHHLERAVACRRELGRRDPAVRALAARASERLAEAGRRALARRDAHAAIGLLERSLRLAEQPPALVEVALGAALYEEGRLDEARERLAAVRARAEAQGDERARWRATAEAALVVIDTEHEPRCEELIAAGEHAAERLLVLGDPAGAARAWHVVAVAHHQLGRQGARLAALERSVALLRGAGEGPQAAIDQIASALFSGPTPLGEARERCAALLSEAHGSPSMEAAVLEFLGGMALLAGERDEGRRLLTESRARYVALGGTLNRYHIAATSGIAELLSGEPEAAILHLREADGVLGHLGERSRRSTNLALLSIALAETGKVESALVTAERARRLGAPDDAYTQIAWRIGRAAALVHLGVVAEALPLAHEAYAVARPLDAPVWSGIASLGLAQVLHVAGRDEAARAPAVDAVERFARKGALPLLERAQRLAAATGARVAAARGG